MLEGKGVIGETDMLQTMQQDALRVAEKALDVFDVTDSIGIAASIKKVMGARVAMHCGDGFWFICDPLPRLFHPLLHRQPCRLAI